MITINTITRERLFIHLEELVALTGYSKEKINSQLRSKKMPSPISSFFPGKTRKWFCCEIKPWLSKEMPNKMIAFKNFLKM